MASQRPLRGIEAPGGALKGLQKAVKGLPESAIVLAERLLSTKSPGEAVREDHLDLESGLGAWRQGSGSPSDGGSGLDFASPPPFRS